MSPWYNFAVALALGLLIGLERERSKGAGAGRRPAGIRTFALASLLGAVALHVGGQALLAAALLGIIALTALAYQRGNADDPGLTTETGLLIAPLLGALAMAEPLLSAGLAVCVAVVFAAKRPLHGFVKGVLTDAEVKDGLIFAIATLIIWPQLPDRTMGPFDAINPHQLWLLVILVMAIGAVGHAATRILGPRFGLPLAGLAAGFVSSTATIGAMASRAKREPGVTGPAVAGAALSTVATFMQMALLLLAVSPPTFWTLAPALLAGAAVAAAYAIAFTWRGAGAVEAPQAGRAFNIMVALGFGAAMAAMLILSAAMQARYGQAGIVGAAALGGLVDTHSASISVASLVASGELAPQSAVIPILAAMTANGVSKTVMAISLGSRGYAVRIVPGVVLSILMAWLVAWP